MMTKAIGNSTKNTKEYTFYVKGMHCASCEVLIEKRLLELKGIKSVEASVSKGEVLIEYENEKPRLENLNKIFKKEGYIFFTKPQRIENGFNPKEFFTSVGIGLLIIVGFILLNKLGLSKLVNVNSKSSLPIFFVFGAVAGISSCAALIGGLVLSLAKQWGELYGNKDSTMEKIQPHLMFNLGRLISYALLGATLGAIGSKLQILPKFTSILVIAVSLMMIFLALPMLGLKVFRRLKITMPKFITRYIADESNFKGRYLPLLMGVFTFFLPCGFTITAQGSALISGSAIQGGLIMLSFALGTLPMLLFIGLSSVKLLQRPHLSLRFLKVAGILVLFFAFYNINSQLNVLGFSSFSDISTKPIQQPNAIENKTLPQNDGFPPIINGKQIVKMEAASSGYKPNYFKIKAGIPVRWEITDVGTSGCTNAIISKSLFEGEIKLTPGKVSIKEFTPEKPGKYKFSCWMGMVSGVIEVVGKNNSGDIAKPKSEEVPAGIGSCGCGGGCQEGCGNRNMPVCKVE